MFTSYLDIFRHIVAYLKPCATLTYSESCHTLHPSIFRTQDIFRTLPRHIAAYIECYVTFVCWEPYHLQTFAIFRILGYLGPLAYSEFCLLGTFRHIQTYSIIIVIITLTFFFFTLILYTFPINTLPVYKPPFQIYAPQICNPINIPNISSRVYMALSLYPPPEYRPIKSV